MEGNEQADLHASGAAWAIEGLSGGLSEGGDISLAALKAARTRRLIDMWRDEDIKRNKGKGVFRCPERGSRPRLRRELGSTPKGLASRFYQLAGGHAMLSPFLKERFGQVESDVCW